MNISPTTPPYEFEHQHHSREERLPALKRIFDLIDHSVTRSDTVPSQPPSPPDLLHDSEEDDEDTLSTPSLSLSPEEGFLLKDHHDLINRSNNIKNRPYSHGVVRPIIPLHHRRKSVPHKSPSLDQNSSDSHFVDKSVVFQLGLHSHASNTTIEPALTSCDIRSAHATNQSCPNCGDACDWKCTSKIICGQSLLSILRKRVASARSLKQMEESTTANRLSHRKRTRTPSIIQIPRSNHRRYNSLPEKTSNNNDDDQSAMSNGSINHHEETAVTTPESRHHPWSDYQHHQRQPKYQDFIHREQMKTDQDEHVDDDQHQVKRVKKSSNTPRRRSSTHGTSSGRPSRVKGPCQACQEPSDGCMRKAFNWPFPSNQIFNDKGKPFVYLCNKCGLRYNKSGGCVCRNCRWVFCKEEKRKALQHIEAMRRSRADGHVDLNEDIENFVCSPKYWSCGKTWKVGWVLDNLDEEDEVSSPVLHAL